jgi:hypothetical protein
LVQQNKVCREGTLIEMEDWPENSTDEHDENLGHKNDWPFRRGYPFSEKLGTRKRKLASSSKKPKTP